MQRYFYSQEITLVIPDDSEDAESNDEAADTEGGEPAEGISEETPTEE